MSLKPDQEQWIENVAGLVPSIDAAVLGNARKEEMLEATRKVVEDNVGDIQLGSDFKVEMTRKVLPDYEMETVKKDGPYDPEREFDPVHDLKGSKVDPSQLKKLQHAQAILTRESEILRRAKDEQTGKPLFSDREIADAIWEPLKRRKILGEGFIPNRYSEVSRGFERAAAMYEERLDAYNESQGDDSKWSERLGLIKDGVDLGGALVKGVVADFRALDMNMGGMTTEQVGKIAKGVSTGLSTTLDLSKTLVDNRGKLNGDVVEAAVKSVITVTQAEISAGLSGKDDAHQALGKAISSGIGLAVNATSLMRKAASGTLDLGAVAGDLRDAINNAVGVYAGQLESKLESGGMSKDDAEKITAQFTNAGEKAAAAIGSSGLIAQFAKNPTRETLTTALNGMIGNVVKAAGNIVIDNYSSDKFDDAMAAVDATLRDIYKADAKKREEMKQDPKLKPLVLQVEKELADATGGKGEEEAAKDWQKELDDSNRDFRDALNRSETGEGEEDIETVERLIADMQRDQQMVDLAFGLVSAGAEAVTTFLPAAGIAVSAVALVKSLTKAREHWIAFSEWKENFSDARTAMSFQMEAMLNRKNNSRDQGLDASINALTSAILIVTKSVGVAGPFAPAGQIATSVVQGVDGIKKFIQKLVAKGQLEHAYSLFVAAQKDPDDRKKIREAVRKNATLAKYVIAWGALEYDNPVCKRAMAKCGLSDEVLTNKNTNADKCVSFLETLYPEDPIVLKTAERPAAWHPGPVAWSSGSLGAFVKAAETTASPKLEPGQFRGLVVQMTQWEGLDAACKKAREAWSKAAEEASDDEPALMIRLQKALDAAEGAAAGLARQFRATRPKRAGGTDPHEAFADYLSELRPLGLGIVRTYRREAEAFERMDGALQRHPYTNEMVEAKDLPKG